MFKKKSSNKNNWFIAIILLIFLIVFINTIVSMLLATYVRYRITVKVEYFVYLDYFGPSALLKNAHQLAFFTNQSNIIFSLALLLLLLWPKNQRVIHFFFFTTILLLIVFVLFWTLLSWVWPWGQVLWLDYFYLMTHGIFPIVGLTILYFIRTKIKITIVNIFYAIIYLQLYYIFLLSLHIASAIKYGIPIAVYPFAQFSKPFFYLGGNIAIVITINIVSFFVFTLLPLPIILLYRYVYKLKSEKLCQEFLHLLKIKKRNF